VRPGRPGRPRGGEERVKGREAFQELLAPGRPGRRRGRRPGRRPGRPERRRT